MNQHLAQKNNSTAKSLSYEQQINPWLNPAHVLSPPRAWLESVQSGEWPWMMFRFAYKKLLRQRWEAEPLRFLSFLPKQKQAQPVLICACCNPEHCHAPLAREFLQELAQTDFTAADTPVTELTASDSPAADSPAEKKFSISNQTRNAQNLRTILTSLTETPVTAYEHQL